MAVSFAHGIHECYFVSAFRNWLALGMLTMEMKMIEEHDTFTAEQDELSPTDPRLAALRM